MRMKKLDLIDFVEFDFQTFEYSIKSYVSNMYRKTPFVLEPY